MQDPTALHVDEIALELLKVETNPSQTEIDAQKKADEARAELEK